MSLEHDATTLDVEVHRVTRAGPSAARPSAGMTSRPEEVGISPLKVSADRIGATAMRCAFLLAALEAEGVEIDRSGRRGKPGRRAHALEAPLRWLQGVENASDQMSVAQREGWIVLPLDIADLRAHLGTPNEENS